jgi:ribokinase
LDLDVDVRLLYRRAFVDRQSWHLIVYNQFSSQKYCPMSQPHIVVVGSVNTDMVIVGEKIPRPGETLTGGEFVMVNGGKGANQAVAAARLGARVTLVARVGDEMLGHGAIENFQREGIATDAILLDTQLPTGTALILVDAAGENSIAVAPGANGALSTADVEAAFEKIDPPDIVLLQLEIPLETAQAAARLAHAAGATVVLDPAPAIPLPKKFLELVDCITPNETEAELLTGIAVTEVDTARQAAARLIEMGASRVIITLGGQGSLLVDSDGQMLIPTCEVKPVDTTAAGDAFNGGLAYGLGSGKTFPEAIAVASQVGALAVTKLGAQTSLPTARELADFQVSTKEL